MENKGSNNHEKEIKIPYKFESRYAFKESLVRIIRLINEERSIEDLVKRTKLPFIFSKDNSPIQYEYNLKEISSYNTYSEVKWLLTNKNILTPIKLYFTLTENMLDKTVLVVFELSIEKRELVPDEYKNKIITLCEGIANDILKNMIIKLKTNIKDVYHYQSKNLNYSRDKILKAIINLNEIMTEKGIITKFTASGELNKEGTILNFFIVNSQKEVKLKINEIKTNENDVKWIINYVPLNASIYDSLLELVLVKLSNNQTLVINNNKYIEEIGPNILKNFTERKIPIFELIEETIKRKYSEI